MQDDRFTSFRLMASSEEENGFTKLNTAEEIGMKSSSLQRSLLVWHSLCKVSASSALASRPQCSKQMSVTSVRLWAVENPPLHG